LYINTIAALKINFISEDLNIVMMVRLWLKIAEIIQDLQKEMENELRLKPFPYSGSKIFNF
jgi:hypothetical protein